MYSSEIWRKSNNQIPKQREKTWYLHKAISLFFNSSLYFSAASFRACTWPFNLSVSALCFSIPSWYCDSHMDFCSPFSANLYLKKINLNNQERVKFAFQTKILEINLYLCAAGWPTVSFALGKSPGSRSIPWFSLSLPWGKVNHGLAGFGSLGSDVGTRFFQTVWRNVLALWTPLWAPDDWAVDVKCDGGMRSLWTLAK